MFYSEIRKKCSVLTRRLTLYLTERYGKLLTRLFFSIIIRRAVCDSLMIGKKRKQGLLAASETGILYNERLYLLNNTNACYSQILDTVCYVLDVLCFRKKYLTAVRHSFNRQKRMFSQENPPVFPIQSKHFHINTKSIVTFTQCFPSQSPIHSGRSDTVSR